MSELTCRRCGQTKPAMAEPPLAGRWGMVAQGAVCADCWRDWVEEQTRLINHERLQPATAGDREILYQRMQAFLRLAP